MIPIIITAYVVCGVVFMSLIEDSQPKKITNNKFLRVIIGVFSAIFWLPWLLINLCFPKRDIWFRLK